MIKFTKKQQAKINTCINEKAKQSWIEHFTHVQQLKQLPEYKAFMKADRIKQKALGVV